MTTDGNRPVAVITGGASGFGLALGEHCAERGMAVALLDIDGDRAIEEAAQLATARDVPVAGRRVDVASAADVEDAAAEITERFGRCDLLFANVGVQHFGAVETIDDDVWRWVLDVNVVGTARVVRSFLPLLRATEGARLALTASANALAPAARLGAYQASKYAVVGLAETLRIELAPDIGVTTIYPSGMFTRHLESSAAARPTDLGSGDVADEDIEAMMASRPLSEVDLTTAEAAAEAALAGVLAGEDHVITHGDLAGPITAHHAAIDAAVAPADSTHRHVSALFERDGSSIFVPTANAVGPWDKGIVHGAAVSALFAGQLTPAEDILARVTVEFLRPVPVAPLTFECTPPQGGTRVQRQDAVLTCDGRTVATARSVIVRRGDLDLPAKALGHDSPFDPGAAPTLDQPHRAAAATVGWDSFDSSSLIIEFLRLPDDTRTHQWIGLAVPVVEGTELRGTELAAVAADYAQSAVNRQLPFSDWSFRNTEVTIHLAREPVGRWIGMRCESVVQPVGAGFNAADLFDADGQVGRSAAALVVERRPT